MDNLKVTNPLISRLEVKDAWNMRVNDDRKN